MGWKVIRAPEHSRTPTLLFQSSCEGGKSIALGWSSFSETDYCASRQHVFQVSSVLFFFKKYDAPVGLIAIASVGV